MSLILKEKIFIGSFIHINKDGDLQIVDRAAIHIKDGKIYRIVSNLELIDTKGKNTIVLSKNQFLIPGFIDCHIHAVQLPNIGIGYDKKLLNWLETYTFPLEIRYADEKYAKQVFNIVVNQTIKQGTTTACYFASLYSKASVILGKAAMDIGQRAFIGKLSMNERLPNDYYETTEKSIENLNKFIEEITNLNSPLIKPIITPRFALSCDMELMKKLGKIAKERNLHIQTHISENLDEVKEVRKKFPNCSSYAAVYNEAGLLTNKTVLAHGIYLSDDEIKLLVDHGSTVAHCPSSNTCLKSGLCDVQRLKQKGVKIGLGTDVSGGQSCSILDSMRQALQVSTHLSLTKENCQALNYKDVFHMATIGGAAALAIDDQVGNFQEGKEFDALVIDTSVGILNNLRDSTLEERLQQFIYSGDDRNIVEVYVHGCKVK
ncbi:guanine deaminase [Xylocopa sonorina]|uniref:guanine deaminase n=1 Tax=Xylocopa sonorina TaxID=1818115 RepID=UPI00403B1CB9